MPKISVIVPVYNVEKYLRECVDSILAQTFADFELILVDDGSPDNCGVICDEYARKDTRVRVIHQENQGLSGARNAGLNVMRGQYVTFVDSDDVAHPCFLNILYETLIENKADVSVCGVRTFNETPIFEELPVVEPDVITNREAAKQVCKNLKWMPVVCNKLYDRSLFVDNRFPPVDSMRMKQSVTF